MSCEDEPTVPPGYTAEELERDNPYNAWLYEDRPKEDEDELL